MGDGRVPGEPGIDGDRSAMHQNNDRTLALIEVVGPITIHIDELPLQCRSR